MRGFPFFSGSRWPWPVSVPSQQKQKRILKSRYRVTSIIPRWSKSLYFALLCLDNLTRTPKEGKMPLEKGHLFLLLSLIEVLLEVNVVQFSADTHSGTKDSAWHVHVTVLDVDWYSGLPGNMFWSSLISLITQYEASLCGMWLKLTRASETTGTFLGGNIRTFLFLSQSLQQTSWRIVSFSDIGQFLSQTIFEKRRPK